MKESYRQKPFLTLAAGVAAMALLLAGCGGGSSSTTPTTPTTPEPPAPTGPSAEDLFVVAQNSTAAANAAVEDAGQAVTDAVKYAGMLTAMAVDGESATATANAQMILDAEMAGNDAVMAAEQALEDAEEAKTTAMDLDDSATKTSLLAALDAAIENAKSQITAAKMARDVNPVDEGTTTPTTAVDSLKEAVALVKGANPLADDYPMMPAARGKAVADTVKTALGNIVSAAADLAGAPDHATVMNNGSSIEAMTWAMIVGEANVMDVRRFASSAISDVKAMSVMGSMASKLATATATLPADSDAGTAGIQNADGDSFDAAYMGIDGTVFCAGSDCGRSGDGNLTGSWYFTPDSTTMLYIANPDMAGSYMVANMYAEYGYWLAFDADGAATGINTGARQGQTTNTASLNLIRPASATADVTARYSGKAGGISTRGDASGHFTANVNLTATFGAAVTDSSLSGSISGFQGSAANPSWRITLDDATLDANAAGSGIAYGGAAAGAWTTQGYGPAPIDHDGDTNTPDQNQRPAGFFGTFNANFHDGMAAGAYAAD